jgi:hypothetical protein
LKNRLRRRDDVLLPGYPVDDEESDGSRAFMLLAYTGAELLPLFLWYRFTNRYSFTIGRADNLLWAVDAETA